MLFVSLGAVTSAAAKPNSVTDGVKKANLVVEGSSISDTNVGQKARQKIGFPYTANGLLLISFSAGLVLVAAGVGLKTFFSYRQ